MIKLFWEIVSVPMGLPAFYSKLLVCYSYICKQLETKYINCQEKGDISWKRSPLILYSKAECLYAKNSCFQTILKQILFYYDEQETKN